MTKGIDMDDTKRKLLELAAKPSPLKDYLRSQVTTMSLRDRLENWGAWSNTVRKDKKTSHIQVDAEDARLVFQAMERIAPPHAKMLVCAFVSMMTPDDICRRLEILPRPASNFVEAFRKAEAALEIQLKVSQS